MEFLNDNRFIGWLAALLFGLSTLLPWVTVWGLDASASLAGYEIDDGKLGLALAMILGLAASFNRRYLIGAVAAGMLGLCVYEMFRLALYQPTRGDLISEQLTTTYQVRPGFGLIVGGTVALLLLWWSAYRWVANRWERTTNTERVSS